MLAIVMITAYATAHLQEIQGFMQDPSVLVKAHPFNFLLTALLVLAFGPGYFSIDNFFRGKNS